MLDCGLALLAAVAGGTFHLLSWLGAGHPQWSSPGVRSVSKAITATGSLK